MNLIAMIPLAAGFLLDAAVGAPYDIPHPIRAVGSLISFAEKQATLRKHTKCDIMKKEIQHIAAILAVTSVLFVSPKAMAVDPPFVPIDPPAEQTQDDTPKPSDNTTETEILTPSTPVVTPPTNPVTGDTTPVFYYYEDTESTPAYPTDSTGYTTVPAAVPSTPGTSTAPQSDSAPVTTSGTADTSRGSDLSITADTDINGNITLSWNKVDGAKKYIVYLRSGSDYDVVATTKNTTYTYKKAKNGKNTSFSCAMT